MSEIILLENPRRKRRKSRKGKMPAGLKRYWAAKRHRKYRKNAGSNARKVFSKPTGSTRHRPVFYGSTSTVGRRTEYPVLNPRSKKRSTSMARHKKHRRRYRRNPGLSLRGMAGGIGGKLKSAAFGAAAIALNQFVAGKIAAMAKVDPKNKELVQLATALFVLPMIGKVPKIGPAIAGGASVAASVALFNAAKKYLPANVQAQLSGYNFPDASVVAPDGTLQLAGSFGAPDDFNTSGAMPYPSQTF